jgi:hypothetical protein
MAHRRRGKRLAFTVVATVLTTVLVLGLLYRNAMRDHIEAWHLQLTRATRTIEPDDVIPPGHPVEEHMLLHVARSLRRPVIFAPEDIRQPLRWPTRLRIGGLLEANGWHRLEQRFPRRAHVLTRTQPEPNSPR